MPGAMPVALLSDDLVLPSLVMVPVDVAEAAWP
jgi:hypothetical protein